MGLDKAAQVAVDYLLREVKPIDSTEEVLCECCSKHVPKPLRFFRIYKYTLCPTAYYNVVFYLQLYGIYPEGPPGGVRKHYGDYVQRIATDLLAYNLIHDIIDVEAIK